LHGWVELEDLSSHSSDPLKKVHRKYFVHSLPLLGKGIWGILQALGICGLLGNTIY